MDQKMDIEWTLNYMLWIATGITMDGIYQTLSLICILVTIKN